MFLSSQPKSLILLNGAILGVCVDAKPRPDIMLPLAIVSCPILPGEEALAMASQNLHGLSGQLNDVTARLSV